MYRGRPRPSPWALTRSPRRSSARPIRPASPFSSSGTALGAFPGSSLWWRWRSGTPGSHTGTSPPVMLPACSNPDSWRGGTTPGFWARTHEIPYLANQDRWSFLRCGLIDPVSVESFREHNGFTGLEKALADGPEFVLEAVLKSGLRGRGGAAFPTGIKWRTVADAEADQKYITCNADEGDSGTFSDRILMERRPHEPLRGHGHRRIRRRRKQGLHLPAFRVPPHLHDLAGSVGECSFGRLAGREHPGQRFRLRHRGSSRRRRLYLR